MTPARFTEADHEVTPTVLPASGAPVVALASTTTYVVAPVAAFQDALTVKLSAGLVRVICRPLTGPGFGGGLASAGAKPRPTAIAAAVTATAVIEGRERIAAYVWSRESSSRGCHGERPRGRRPDVED